MQAQLMVRALLLTGISSLSACSAVSPEAQGTRDAPVEMDDAEGDSEQATNRDLIDLSDAATTPDAGGTAEIDAETDAAFVVRDAAADAAQASADACVPASMPVSKACTHDDDCVVAFSDACCGGSYYGVNRASIAADSYNRSCRGPLTCGPLGCANIPHTDDYANVSSAQDVRVSCVQGMCRTARKPLTFACGSDTCTEPEYCESFAGGLSTSGTSWSCKTLPAGCVACACFSKNAGCRCYEVQGHLQVDCLAP